MAFIPVPNCARVEMLFRQQGQSVENVWHVTHPSPWDVPLMLGLAGEFKDWWVSTGDSNAVADVSLVAIKVTSLETVNAPGIEFADGLPIPGEDAGQGMPMNVTVSVKLLTGIRGRSFRGRIYHVGMTRDEVTDSQISVGYAEALRADYDFLKATLESTGDFLSVVSYRAGGMWRATGLATRIVAVSVDRTIDSQRRRLPGRGA